MIAKRGDRFVMRYMGDGDPPEADIEHIGQKSIIIDRAGPLLLVECREDDTPVLLGRFLDWLIAPETRNIRPASEQT